MKVWVVKIEHKHGTDIYVHSSKDGADARVLAYVDSWWDHEINKARPEDPETRTDEYFDVMNSSGEFYSIDECEVAP